MRKREAAGLIIAFILALALFFWPEVEEVIEVDEPTFVTISESKAEDMVSAMSVREQGLTSFRELEPALRNSLAYLERRPAEQLAVKTPGPEITWGDLTRSIQELIDMLPRLDDDPELLSERFTWLKVAPGTLLTGYYEPWIKASLVRENEYQVPMYGKPDDLKMVSLGDFHPRWDGQKLVYREKEGRIIPYHSREDIDSGAALSGKGLEIAWTSDPVDVFFLQIQGSGRLVLPDGSVKHILYSGKNGRQYVSIGRVLIDEGRVPREEMSMERIRRYMSENPDYARELMNRNPSYVFFKLSDEGPFGSAGKVLTPRVSVAVDRMVVPLGAVMVLKTAFVDHETKETTPFLSLVTAQDTGGAIKGTRCDLFAGSGEVAEDLAGHLQEEAELYLLVSKSLLDR